ncbi:glycosyltransferase family 4 protein [Zobellia galactanivorans]|uniref:glycosyltransferase family 4 protein n=1 Tax=Zobellia galactanivorans (strain DSM 12802 / CCUG 47099 / CIP 106680 / NCIMB 13871 / Dsij) TaxID=63186 RepID=UPI001C07B740|nr:glycosyltransferase family 4 protein [Zobellia galactanivorans]MBU3024410.1 glycosyltransferase family 4 protein [Zobellia galactanivorans]
MRIDFLINRMSGGGAERVVSLIANYLAEKGHVVRIITFQDTDKYYLNPSIQRVKLHKHPLFQSVVINGFFQLLNFYKKKKNRPDVMSSHICLLGYMTIPVAKILRLKLIVSEHTNHIQVTSFARRFLRTYMYPHADAVTILTKFDQEYFSVRNKNVWLMPNPCPFKITNESHLEKIEKKEILAIGDLNRYENKGFDNLLEICAPIFEKYPDWKIKIVGDGDEGLKFLKNKAKTLGIIKNTIFTGHRTDIKQLLNDCDIFILTSRYEGLPMTLLEAMSQGTCCISFDCISGPSDIITNNINGLLIEDQNIEKMKLGLEKLIENPTLRNKLRSNAPASMEKYTLSNVGQRWQSLLEQVHKNTK